MQRLAHRREQAGLRPEQAQRCGPQYWPYRRRQVDVGAVGGMNAVEGGGENQKRSS